MYTFLAQGGSSPTGSGIASQPLHASTATSQKPSCLLHSELSVTLSAELLSASAPITWSMLKHPAGISGRMFISLPARLCTSFAPSEVLATASLMVATIRHFFFSGSDHVQLTVSYSTPNTTPFWHGANVLSWSSLGANFTPSLSATTLKQLSKSTSLPLSLLAAQMSSRCWQIISMLNFARLHTRSSTTFAASSKMPALDALPKMRHSSTKNFPPHSNHCSGMSSSRTVTCLYALAQSVLVIQAPTPALFSTVTHAAVDDMTAGNSSADIPSLTDIPLGADKFRMILADPLGFFLTIMPLIFAPAGTSSSATGPAAYPSTIQLAMASDTSCPLS